MASKITKSLRWKGRLKR